MAENNNKSKEETGKKERRPQAKKRNLQSLKCKMHNRSFKARVATSIRSLKESVSKKESATAKQNLDEVVSLMDKGVKKGIFKQNKANRVKSQMSTLAKS
ncbi:MAG TPA: 30S ribosomal protein S20 [Rhabdochlamydiaceae bacterium]|jgi:small subunit ribosomal protein S20